MQSRKLLAFTTALLSTALLPVASFVLSSSAKAHVPPPPKPIACTSVAGTVTGSPGVKTVTSAIQAASGPNVAYCRVSVLYGNSVNENINIVVGLPLNSLDGGTGGVQGAWNGRTQGSAAAVAPAALPSTRLSIPALSARGPMAATRARPTIANRG